MRRKQAENRYIYPQKSGWNVQLPGHKSKFFRYTLPDALGEAIAYRDQLLSSDSDAKPVAEPVATNGHHPNGHYTNGTETPPPKQSKAPKPTTDPKPTSARKPTTKPKPRKESFIPWEQDRRTFDLQFKTLELEEDLHTAQYQVRTLTEELIQVRAAVDEFRRNRKVNVNEIEFERFKPMDTMLVVDGNYLFHQEERLDLSLLRKLLEGMIGGRAEALIYVGSLPSDEELKRRSEGYHAYIASAEGGGATVIAHELKETNIYCPYCNGRFERRFQWAGDTAIVAEMMYWAYEKTIPRIILVAGDSDFYYPVQLVRRKCKEVVVAGFRDSLSNRLQGVATRTVFLDEYVNIIKK